MLLALATQQVCAQDSTFRGFQDSTYYRTQDGFLTGRFYFGNKYSMFDMVPIGNKDKTISYRPNTPTTMGIGGTYQWLTINLAFGFKFLNQYKSDRGETNYLDLQTHLYGRRSIVDFNTQFYKGFYLKPTKILAPPYYLRPDIGITQVGLNYEHIFNWRRFSFRASMLQSERQLKSAGSPLVGISLHYLITSGDSSFIPGFDSYDSLQPVSRLRNVDFGPSAGYAYTVVMAKRVFITGAITGQININFAKGEHNEIANTQTTVNPNVVGRVAMGYQHPKWSIAATWVNQNLTTKAPTFKYNVRAGQVRLAFAYRFIPGSKLKKFLRPVDHATEKVINKMKAKFAAMPLTK
ncbi:MAG TPA: DUF4421 domain-containing protein [Phnomibacter sp.]|nr:DUF4421 domain-containing protein [Phnomibacter sp.]